MARRLTFDQWARIRAAWESDPKHSYESAAEAAGKRGRFAPPSRAAICDRVKAEGWQKRNELPAINEGAYRRADKVTSPPKTEPNKKRNRTSTEQIAPEPNEQAPLGTPSGRLDLATRDESEQKRADILVAQRNRASAVAAIMGKAFKAGLDPVKPSLADMLEWLRAAKLAGEAIRILGEAENAAWGISPPIPQPPGRTFGGEFTFITNLDDE